MALTALKRIESGGARVLGVVLTKFDHASGLGGDYGYAYNYGAKDHGRPRLRLIGKNVGKLFPADLTMAGSSQRPIGALLILAALAIGALLLAAEDRAPHSGAPLCRARSRPGPGLGVLRSGRAGKPGQPAPGGGHHGRDPPPRGRRTSPRPR